MIFPLALYLLLQPTCATGWSATAPAYLAQEGDQACADLEREFNQKALEWRSELRAAKKAKDAAAEAAVSARNPIKEYYPRFELLYKAGSAQAALWLVSRVEDMESEAERIAALKEPMLKMAVESLAAGKQAKEVLKALGEQKKCLEPSTLEGLYADFAQRTSEAELASKALLERGKSLLNRAEGEAESAQAIAALELLLNKYPESKAAESARGVVYEFRNLRVGCNAPDFSTEDVDGAPFKLSDYRGKVVLLDFWGFW